MNRYGNGTGSGRAGARRSGITVTGTGTAAAAVDQVVVTLGIAVIRADAGEAFQAATATVGRVLGILADDGADSRSVRTADLTLGPELQYREQGEHLVGYRAGQRLNVQLAGLAGLERMLTDVAMRGGEGVRIEGVQLSPSDPSDALIRARAVAYADALAKAQQLVRLAGRELGELSWIDERPQGEVFLDAMRAVPLAAGAAKMPVATGDTLISTAITAHWEFAAPPS